MPPMAKSNQSPRRCGRGSGNPWTPSTVPNKVRSNPVRSPLTVASLPTDSTYSVSEFLQQHLTKSTSSLPLENLASANADSACTVADSRMLAPDLGPDLLHSIFIRLAPNPKDLAPLEPVCR